MAYEIIWWDNGLVVECAGILNCQSINEANEQVQSDLRVDDSRFQIWNFLKADLSRVTCREMRRLAAVNRVAAISVPQMRIAFVVQGEAATALCGHYVKEVVDHGSRWESSVFALMDEAIDWAAMNAVTSSATATEPA